MASGNPGSVQPEGETLDELEESLLSMENIDRPSPELWPEKFPGITDFINSYSQNNSNKSPYDKELTREDQDSIHQLAAHSTAGLFSKIKELYDNAYELGLEESKEMTRAKYLNIFTKPRKEK